MAEEPTIFGGVAREVLRQILDLKKDKGVNFSSGVAIDRLQSTLEQVVRLEEEGKLKLESKDGRRKGLKKLTEELQKGKELVVQTCSNVPSAVSNNLLQKNQFCFDRYFFVPEERKNQYLIIRLDVEIRSFCEVEFQVEIRCDNKLLPGEEPTLGAVAEQVLNKILDLKKKKKKDKGVNFSSGVAIDRLQNTLEQVVVFEKKWQLKLEPNDHRRRKGVKKLTKELEKGKELVQTWSKIPSVQTSSNVVVNNLQQKNQFFFDRYSSLNNHYSTKIIRLDGAIRSFCEREFKVQIWCDNKRLLLDVQKQNTTAGGGKGDAKLCATARDVLCSILDMKDKAVHFTEDLEQLQNTLERVVRLFEGWGTFFLLTDLRKRKGLEKLTDELRKGEELVRKCSKVSSRNYFMKNYYSINIIDLDDAIVSFCERDLLVEIWCAYKRLLRGGGGGGGVPLNNPISATIAIEEEEEESSDVEEEEMKKPCALAAGELLDKILEMKDKKIVFVNSIRRDLERLQNTLEHVVPMLKEKVQLDLQGMELINKKLQKGKELVEKCSKVWSWDIYHKKIYSCKIIHLDEVICRFVAMELEADAWLYANKSLIKNEQNNLRIRKPEELIINQHLERTVVGVPVGSNEDLFSVPQLPDCVVGFEIPLIELKSELFRENVTVLGLCATGGCGKSTLAAMLCRDQQVKGKFKDKIFFLTVSRTPYSKILHRLHEEIAGGVITSDLSEEDATKQFHYLLEQRKSEPILLVLDDVWDESIIEKFFYRTEGYKILVTSRRAFQRFNLRYHSKYLLKALSQQDSVTLLRQTARFHDGNEKPDEDLINKIVRCCDGFPLAIVMISRFLSGQPAETRKMVARKLSEGSSILYFDEKLQNCLATILDSLDHKVQECFLDLCSFPKDETIPVSALIDIWCELYELEYEDDAFLNLLELESQNLVNLVRSRKIEEAIDGCFNEQFISQHGLLRDVAISQCGPQSKRLIMDTREKGLPKSWRKRENQYLNARLVSLHTGEMSSESWYDLQLPEVEVMILNFSASNYALPPFMEKMRKLKVLIIVNHGQTHAKISNWKTLGELANLKRIRLEKVSISSLREFTMQLMNLQKISLVRCEIGQALMQCTNNGSYVLPKLVEINIDYCDDLVELPPWICDIISLDTLRITNCHNLYALPEGIGNITDLDLLRLNACTRLSKIPDSIGRLQKLRFLDISDCSNLETLPDEMFELQCLKKLDMRGCIKFRELPPSAMDLVHLMEVICDEDTASLWEPLSYNLKKTVIKKDINLDC